MTHLFLFDIDGTLINVHPLHVEAYQAAYLHLTGKEPTEEQLTSRFGLTEEGLHQEVYRELGIDQSSIPQLIANYQEELFKILQTQTIEPLPGVKDFVESLRGSHHLGVVTGNGREKATRFLRMAGLQDYFSVFGFGDDAESRDEIVQRALTDAQNKQLTWDKLVLIGDTPNDVAAAQRAEAIAVAMTTGSVTRAVLEQTNPDLILDSLVEYEKIMKLL